MTLSGDTRRTLRPVVDDKLQILAAVKKAWGDRLTTVIPRQGKFARDPNVIASYYPPADVTVERIGDLLGYDLPALIPSQQSIPFSPEVTR
jgi:hypothetical protein